ncbi:hypothetical protein HN51_036094, partial [Arachis hypogaea]
MLSTKVHHARELNNTFRCKKVEIEGRVTQKLYCSMLPPTSCDEDNFIKNKRNI